MASKEAEEYFESEWADNRVYYVGQQSTETLNKITTEEAIEEAFDAGVESVNKRIGEVNDYYDQLKNMSEDYQAGYIQAEKDMPKQFEAVRDIIKLQKEIDALKEYNKWHNLKENPEDLPPVQEYEINESTDHWKWYLVKTDCVTFKSCGHAICARVLIPRYSDGVEEPTWVENDSAYISDSDVFEWKELN